jgi:hypothetical protein
MTDISNKLPFFVLAPKGSPYEKYDIAGLEGSYKHIFPSSEPDGTVDYFDVHKLLSTGKKDEVNGLIKQLKTDKKLTEAEKVERFKADYEAYEQANKTQAE